MTSELIIEPLTPFIGAEITGVDLKVVTKEQVADIRAALLKHQVVFFRDQTLNQQEHIHFARQFGELEIHPATPKGQNRCHMARKAITRLHPQGCRGAGGRRRHAICQYGRGV